MRDVEQPRRLTLSRETLRDLDPTDEQTAMIKGGTDSGALCSVGCGTPIGPYTPTRTG